VIFFFSIITPYQDVTHYLRNLAIIKDNLKNKKKNRVNKSWPKKSVGEKRTLKR